jgi:hypothetical protein
MRGQGKESFARRRKGRKGTKIGLWFRARTPRIPMKIPGRSLCAVVSLCEIFTGNSFSAFFLTQRRGGTMEEDVSRKLARAGAAPTKDAEWE